MTRSPGKPYKMNNTNLNCCFGRIDTLQHAKILVPCAAGQKGQRAKGARVANERGQKENETTMLRCWCDVKHMLGGREQFGHTHPWVLYAGWVGRVGGSGVGEEVGGVVMVERSGVVVRLVVGGGVGGWEGAEGAVGRKGEEGTVRVHVDHMLYVTTLA